MKEHVTYQAFHDRESSFRFFYSENADTQPHFHRCIEMLYITAGRADCTVDGESFTAEKDDIVFVRRCAAHSLRPAPTYANYVAIVKTAYADDFEKQLEKETLPPHLADKAYNRTLRPLLPRMLRAMREPSFLVMKGYADILLGSLLQHYERRPFSPTPNLSAVVDALNYIDEHFAEPLTLDALAAHFGYNKYYFSRLFNAYIGENMNNYINAVRVRKLAEAAKHTENVNVSDLAFACGFDSMTTFYRHFERIYGRAPSDVFGK